MLRVSTRLPSFLPLQSNLSGLPLSAGSGDASGSSSAAFLQTSLIAGDSLCPRSANFSPSIVKATKATSSGEQKMGCIYFAHSYVWTDETQPIISTFKHARLWKQIQVKLNNGSRWISLKMMASNLPVLAGTPQGYVPRGQGAGEKYILLQKERRGASQHRPALISSSGQLDTAHTLFC